MRKGLKILGVLLGVLVLLLVALAVALPLLFDINDHKDRIATEVEAATGRVLVIDGDLELTVFPWLGVRSGAMSLGQAGGFGDGPFAAFSEAQVRVRLAPLVLRREVEIGRIALSGLRLNLEIGEDGRDNWSDMARGGATVEELPEDAPAADPMGELERLHIEGLVLRDARITFHDRRSGDAYTIEGFDLTTGEIRVGRPLQVDMRADVTGDALPFERAQATLSGRFTADLEAEVFSAEALRADIVMRGGDLPGEEHAIRLEAAARADLGAQTLDFGPVIFDGFGLGVALEGSGTRILEAPSLTGRLDVAAFSPRTVLGDLGVELPETADPRVLTHLQLSGGFTAGESSASIEDLTLRLDDTSVSGRLVIADFDTQALRFDLTVDGIEVDRYLPPVSDAADDDAPVDLDAIEIPQELDDVVRGLDLEGIVRIGSMQAAGLRSGDISVTIRAQDGQLRVHPAMARMYGGGYSGDIALDVRGDTPRISMDERMEGVQSDALFSDLFEVERISGTAGFTARLTADGRTIGQMRRTLNGRVSFDFADGAVQGFDLWHMLRDARAVLRQEPRPQKSGPDETPFVSLAGSGTVDNGVMRNDDLAAVLPFMRVAGRGSIDLAGETVDYRLETTVLDRPGVDAVAGMGELKGRTVPVVITGPFDDLSYSVDIASVLEEEVKERIQDRVRDALRRRFQR